MTSPGVTSNEDEMKNDTLLWGKYHVEHNFVIGAQKCGTTSLCHWLGQHPDICFSKDKEQRFWLMDYHKGLKFHQAKSYKHYAHERMTMEGKPLNFHVHFAAERMHDAFSDAKCIAIFRNPIERAYSAWSHFRRMRIGREPRVFSEAMYDNLNNYSKVMFVSEGEYMMQADPMGGCYTDTYIGAGFYYHHLMRFVDLFGKKNILVLDYESLNDPYAIIQECCTFLDLPMQGFHAENRRVSPDRTTIDDIKRNCPIIVEKLMRIYSDDAILLSDNFGINFAKQWGMR